MTISVVAIDRRYGEFSPPGPIGFTTMEERELSSPELEAEVRGMIGRGHTIAATKRLREATGWCLADVKMWVDRTLEGHESTKTSTGKPCPYCGKGLRTDRAKQCFECGTDWHDASNIIRRRDFRHPDG